MPGFKYRDVEWIPARFSYNVQPTSTYNVATESALTTEMLMEKVQELLKELKDETTPINVNIVSKTYWKESREVDLMVVKK